MNKTNILERLMRLYRIIVIIGILIPLIGYIWYKYTTPQDFLVDVNSELVPYEHGRPMLACESGIFIPTQDNQIHVGGKWCSVAPLYTTPYYIVSTHFGAQSIRFIQQWFVYLFLIWAFLFIPRLYEKVRGAMKQ